MNDSDPTDLSTLSDEIEAELISKGLVSAEPQPARCAGCRHEKLDCRDQQVTFIQGVFCFECWEAIEQLDYGANNRGKVVGRYLRDGGRHYAFLEPGKESGVILMVERSKKAEERPWFEFTIAELAWFDPDRYSDDQLREKLKTYVLFT